VRQMAAPSRVDPCLHFLIGLFDFLRHKLVVGLVLEHPGGSATRFPTFPGSSFLGLPGGRSWACLHLESVVERC
jgi:hypothetical protein